MEDKKMVVKEVMDFQIQCGNMIGDFEDEIINSNFIQEKYCK